MQRHCESYFHFSEMPVKEVLPSSGNHFNGVKYNQVLYTRVSSIESLLSTVNDLFSAQCAKQSLFLFNICCEKMSLLAHPS